MTDDLVNRLRCYADLNDAVFHPWVYGEAADRIEKLEAQLAQSQLKRWAARWEEQSARIEKLEDELHHCFHRIEELQAALRGVIAIADRDCPEFRFARKALVPSDPSPQLPSRD